MTTSPIWPQLKRVGNHVPVFVIPDDHVDGPQVMVRRIDKAASGHVVFLGSEAEDAFVDQRLPELLARRILHAVGRPEERQHRDLILAPRVDHIWAAVAEHSFIPADVESIVVGGLDKVPWQIRPIWRGKSRIAAMLQ